SDKGHLRILHLINRLTAELPHRFDRVLHAVNIPFGQIAAAGVIGQRTVRVEQLTVCYERPTFTTFTEAELFEGHEHQWCKVVVDKTDVDIFMPDACTSE